MSGPIVTPVFTLNFPALMTPTADKGRYEITMMFPKTQAGITVDVGQDILGAAKAEAHSVWGQDENQWPGDVLEFTVRDGDCIFKKNSAEVKFPGYWIVKASSMFQPGLVDQNLQPIMSADQLYSGCQCRAQIATWSYNDTVKGNHGVGFNVLHVMKVADGDHLGGERQTAQDAFASYGGAPQQQASQYYTPQEMDARYPQAPASNPQQPAPAPAPANTPAAPASGRMW